MALKVMPRRFQVGRTMPPWAIGGVVGGVVPGGDEGCLLGEDELAGKVAVVVFAEDAADEVDVAGG